MFSIKNQDMKIYFKMILFKNKKNTFRSNNFILIKDSSGLNPAHSFKLLIKTCILEIRSSIFFWVLGIPPLLFIHIFLNDLAKHLSEEYTIIEDDVALVLSSKNLSMKLSLRWIFWDLGAQLTDYNTQQRNIIFRTKGVTYPLCSFFIR